MTTPSGRTPSLQDVERNSVYATWRCEFGRRLREARTRKGLTQHEVAAKVFGTHGKGQRQPYLSKIERGQVNVTARTMLDLARVIGVDLKTLV